MAFSIPAFIQKRILRYALSRFDIFDPKDLDLEHLDIAWGKRSTFELRDVGLQVERLTELLWLPDYASIRTAKIALLRLSIPADIHASGIQFEAEGLYLDVFLDLEHGGQKASHKSKGKAEDQGTTAYPTGSPQHHQHDSGGDHPRDPLGEPVDPNLPTTEALARSFVASEPPQERAQFKEALAKSQSIDQSSLAESTASELGGGYGEVLSLPYFVADFLEGIKDRAFASVKDICVDIGALIDFSSLRGIRGSGSYREDVKLRLVIGELQLHPCQDTDSPSAAPSDTAGSASRNRRVAARDIRAVLLTDPSLFSFLSQSSGPSSPLATHQSSFKTHSQTSSRNTSDSLESPKSTLSRHHETLAESSARDKAASDLPENVEKKSALESDSSPSSDGPHQVQWPVGRTLDLSESISLDTDQKDHCSILDSPLGEFHSSNEGYTQSLSADEDSLEHLTDDDVFESSESALPPDDALKHANELEEDLDRTDQESSTMLGPDFDIFNSIPEPQLQGLEASEHELTESRIFSHEEAASMYESAMSMPPPTQEAIPGSWLDDNPMPAPIRQEQFEPQQEAVEPIVPKASQPSSQEAEIAKDLVSPQQTTIEGGGQPTDSSPNPIEAKAEPSNTTPRDTALTDQDLQGRSQNAKAQSLLPAASALMGKEFFSIDELTILFTEKVSSLDKDSTYTSRNTSQGQNTLPVSHNTSLAFSSEVASSNASIELQSTGFTSQVPSDSPSSYAFKFGRITLLSDITLIRLAVLSIPQAQSTDGRANKPSAQSSSQKDYFLKVSVDAFDSKLVNSLDVVSLQHTPGNEDSARSSNPGEVLLEFKLQSIHYARKVARGEVFQEFKVGTLTFGYINEPFLSFDSSTRMRDSVRDTFVPQDDNIKMVSGKRDDGSPYIFVTTSTLCIRLDLTRLDELFTWFGGLSSMLELGSSMMTTMTASDSKPKKSQSSNRSRGVRFQTPERGNIPNSEKNHEQIVAKLDARIGGLNIVVIGGESSFNIDGTAVKIARRNEAVRVKIDKLRARGPYDSVISKEVAPMVLCEAVTLDYIPSPTNDDLDRLLALLSPSKDRDDQADDILLDTFLRQRRQGAILRAAIKQFSATVDDIEQLDKFSRLADDLKKLSTVAKFLPDDDRPGLLLLGRIEKTRLDVEIGRSFGPVSLELREAEFGQVTLPSLFLIGIGSFKLEHQGKELLGSVVDYSTTFHGAALDSPMIVGRMIGDEMDPTLKLTLWNARIEYHVSTLIALMDLQANQQDKVNNDSTSTLRRQELGQEGSVATSRGSSSNKPLKFNISLLDSALALNPHGSPAKALLFFQNANLEGCLPGGEPSSLSSSLTIKKLNILLIDDPANLLGNTTPYKDRLDSPTQSLDPYRALLAKGYISVSDISAATISICSQSQGPEDQKNISVEIRDELLVLETCADSTQTLITVFNGLNPPTPPSKQLKYRTEIVPMQDMLASLYDTEVVAESEMPENEELSYDDDADTLSLGDSFHDMDGSRMLDHSESQMTDSQTLATEPIPDLEGSELRPAAGTESLLIDEEHFGAKIGAGGENQRWNSSKNAFELVPNVQTNINPFDLRVRDVHFIWNLFDGYDWDRTRETISQAVADLEAKAAEAQAKRDKQRSVEMEEEDPVIGDFLFNSIYIGVGVGQNPRDFAQDVNRNIDDLVSETASQTTGVTSPKSSSPSRYGVSRPRRQRLRLKRSRQHKMTFELKGVNVDVVTHSPSSGETQSSIDVRIRDLDIFDHVPTSTWKKFATYMHDAGQRESGTSMVHISVLNVRPVPDLEATEMVVSATVLPLRLHVDQDALDFMSRFFEFKDDSAVPTTGSAAEVPFIQRAEVSAVPVKLDFKPKRVDYAGLRSGRTTEFMNFMVLDAADMVLRHVIIYGVSGFDRLGKTLNDVWMPDIRKNQLPGVLAGLAPVRPLVNVGAGVRDLVLVPIHEYKKDGRVLRSLQKGALQFAKTTTTELAKLGVKLAVGTHTVLQNTEGVLNPQSPPTSAAADEFEDGDSPLEEKIVFSPYADAPAGVAQGLRGAYRHLARDLLLAKDAVVAMPGEVMDSGSASGAAKAVLKSAPTVILRPALGVTKALGQTLMGATASLDRDERRRVEDKYKRR